MAARNRTEARMSKKRVFYFNPTPAQIAVPKIDVRRHDRNGTRYTFTMFDAPGDPEQQFAQALEVLAREVGRRGDFAFRSFSIDLVSFQATVRDQGHPET